MKQIKAWGVQRRCDNVLFDDAVYDENNEALYIYPIFKKKKHAQIYLSETFSGKDYGRIIAKIVKITLTI